MQPNSQTGTELQNLATAYYNQRQSILKSPEYYTASQKHELTIKQYETYHQRIKSLISIHQKLTTQGISITLPTFPEVHTAWINEDRKVQEEKSILGAYTIDALCLQLTENKTYHYQLSLETYGSHSWAHSTDIDIKIIINRGITPYHKKVSKLEEIMRWTTRLYIDKGQNKPNGHPYYPGTWELEHSYEIDRFFNENLNAPSLHHICYLYSNLIQLSTQRILNILGNILWISEQKCSSFSKPKP